MPWYKAGTVSVVQNSSTVTGVGTAFVANSRVGDAFRGPDGGWYEVVNIASDAALSISPAYQGPSLAAGGYALAPMQGYVKDSADALRGLVNQFGTKLAAMGTTANFEILPVSNGGTGGASQADARTGLGLGSVATESTVPVAKGGTGATTQSTARTNLGLGSAAVATLVGTVSQNGGSANGAVIERGSNANGNYTKFADGTQICTYKSMTIKTIGTPTGALYCSTGEGARGFPLVFASPPSISITACLEEGEGFFLGASTILNSTTQWPNGFVMSQVPRRNQYVFVDYVAIGRWY